MDFIVSKDSKSVLLVLVERKSKYLKIKLLENRKNTLVNQEVFSLLKNEKVLSITTDNDIAFSN
jgi:IS30 family transposase